MARENVLALLLGVILVGSCATAVWGTGEEEFIAPKPEEWVKGDAGRVEKYSKEFKQLQDANLAAAIVIVEPESLILPVYHDAPIVLYVLQGKARAGLIAPSGCQTNMRDIKRGDFIAIPKGWTAWMWNYDSKEALKMVAAGQTARGIERAWVNVGFLMGKGGVIQGFGTDMLSRAWNVEEDEVKELLKAQENEGFVKVGHKDVPALPMENKHHDAFGDFVYNVDHATPDLKVKGGGSLTMVNAQKLPVLHRIGLSMTRIRLERGAILAPHYTNAARIIHVVRGRGRIEVTYPEGRSALKTDMKAGDTIVVPAMLPLAAYAFDDEELQLVSFCGKAVELPSFLAGYNSLYHALPREVARTGFNLEEERFDRIWKTRRHRHEIGIFPPRKSQQSILGRGPFNWMSQAEDEVTQFEKFLEDLHHKMAKSKSMETY